MLTDPQILRLNPWWMASRWEADDVHLRRLEASPVQLATPQVEEMDLGVPAIHILRGPRQAGKSTDLKLLARRALRTRLEPRQVVYLSLVNDHPKMSVDGHRKMQVGLLA